MNQEELIACIQNPALLKPEYLADIDKLTQKHPGFQAIKILKLKILKDTNDLAFSDYLKEVAIAVPDRTQLYKVLLREEVKEHIQKALESDKKEETPAEPVLDESNKTTTEKSIEEVLETIKKHKAESDKKDQQDLNEEEDVPVIIELKGKEKLADQTEELNTQKTDSTQETDKAQIEALTDAVLDELIQPDSHTLYQIEKVFSIEDEGDIENDVNTDDTFHEAAETTTKPSSFLDWLEPKKATSQSPSSSEIIDRFIKNKPRISKFDKQKSISENLQKIVDKDSIVTETLARIYIKQKNYKKAIDIYKKLSLNIPEKKGYFASQIHFLEELIKKD